MMVTRSEFFKTIVIILFLSTILFIYYNPLQESITLDNNITSNTLIFYTYGELEQQLCQKTIGWTRKSLLNDFACPGSEQFVSIVSIGRSGNRMWSYASVMAIAQQTGLTPYVPYCIKSDLEIFFENLTIPTFQAIAHCPVKTENFIESIDNWNFIQSIDDWKSNPQTIILPRYLIEPQEIMPWIPSIWQEFTLKKSLKDSAQQTLRSITNNLPTLNYTFVAVHIRRTDYKGYLLRKYGEDLASPQFFLNAMAFFKEKYSDILFIMVSDDPQWCIKQFSSLNDVFVISKNKKKNNDPALDMALMVACNHTIFDYGTFGEWGAILAGGEVVCYDMIQNSKNGSMQYNTSWHLMS